MKKNKIEKLLVNNKGVLKTADVVAAGIAKETFYRYVKEAGFEKISHGIYLSPDAWVDEMYLLQAQIPKAVYSHESALYLHDLAEKEPVPLTVTVPAKYNSAELAKKNVKIIYIKKEWHMLGACQVLSPSGHSITVYDMERTICDLLRSRNRIEIQTYQEALKAYARRKDKNLRRLMQYAGVFRVEKILRQYLEVLL